MYKLTKSIYGLKVGPTWWHEKFNSCIVEKGYKPNGMINIFTINLGIVFMLLLVYM